MGDECCKDGKCDCSSDYCEMSGKMVCLADKAWACLMMEKMKAEWEKARGPTMEKVAKLSVEHSMAVWKARMEAQDMKKQLSKEEIEKFRAELGKAFMS